MPAAPWYQTFTATATGTPACMDWTQTPFNASFAVEVKNGTATFGVQYTLDDLNAVTTATWFNDANVAGGSTASAAGNYTFPVTFLRCNVSAISTGGTVVFAVLQGFSQAY